MLSTVLNSERALQVNIAIMRTFVKLRKVLSANRDLAQRLSEMERRLIQHDSEIRSIFEVIRQLMNPVEKTKRRIGFKKG